MKKRKYYRDGVYWENKKEYENEKKTNLIEGSKKKWKEFRESLCKKLGRSFM
jgi:hypothetical protein